MFVKMIPNLLTIGNLFVGIIAMIFALKGEDLYINYAAIMVIIGMLLDGLDGRLARLLKAQSEFGKELDSLSDIVTFGVAPALIMYEVFLQEAGWLGILITALFPICGALRLARFNAETYKHKGYFIGLPITAAGGVLATLALYHHAFPHLYLALGMIGLSFLMVSNLKYPNFKKAGFPRSSMVMVLVILLVVAIMAIQFPQQFPMVIFIPLVIYALTGVKKSFLALIRRRQQENTDEEMLNS